MSTICKNMFPLLLRTKQINRHRYNLKWTINNCSTYKAICQFMLFNIQLVRAIQQILFAASCNKIFEFAENAVTVVNVKSRTDSLQTRKKPPIIYHKLSVPRPYSALKIQMMVDSRQTSTMVILLRHEKLPTKKACDVIKVVRNITKLEGKTNTLGITQGQCCGSVGKAVCSSNPVIIKFSK